MPDAACRVLLVLAESTGGIGRHVRLIASALPAHGIEVSICAPDATARDLRLDDLGVAVTVAPVGRSGIEARRRVRKSLRAAADGADVVHAHGLRAAAAAARYAGSRPLVTTWHNAAPDGLVAGFGYAALSHYVALRSDVTLTASPDLAALAQRRGARSARDFFVCAPPLPAPERGRDAVRAELGVAADRLVVLAVGRLAAQKRFEDLVTAAAGWAGSDDPPAVLIAGEGPARAHLSASIAAAGAPVRLLGARADVADLLAAADIVALPSEWEARSLVAQEALRSGVPLVAAAVGGLPELVGEAGVLVPVRDPHALRQAIESLAGDPAKRARLADAGRAQAATWPSADSTVRELVNTYLDLKGKSRPV